MKKVILLTLSTLLVSGVYWLCTINERGLRNYAAAWFQDRGLQTPSFSCAMNHPEGFLSRSRAGRCDFDWPTSELPSLETKLQLQPKPMTREYEGCSTEPAFSMNVPSILVYVTDNPPGPIFSGNVSTSLLRLYYNKALAKGCIDLHYPYG
jgi:hypothetical protein